MFLLLYSGNSRDALSFSTFESQHITHVINATCDHPNCFEDRGVKYLRVPVNDNVHADLGPHFRKADDFIGKFLFELKINVFDVRYSHMAVNVSCTRYKFYFKMIYYAILGRQFVTLVKLCKLN